MGWLKKFFHRVRQTDEQRLAEEIQAWAESVNGARRIEGCPSREPVRVAGQVSRLTLRPMNGSMTLEAVVFDGTGEVIASWLGRSHIPGLSLGTPVVLEGVIAADNGSYRMVNPRFEFA